VPHRRSSGLVDHITNRNQDPDHEPRLVVGQLDSAAVRADYPAGDGETKPCSAGGPAAVQLVEALEHPAALIGRDAWPAVRDLKPQVAAGSVKANFDGSARLAVAHGVVDEYQQDLAKPITVHLRLDTGFGSNIEAAAAAGCKRLQVFAG